MLVKLLYICNNSANVLKKKNTYQQVAAAFFILLLNFIAAPPALWHQHQYKATTQMLSGAEKSRKVIENVSESLCAICIHQYTAYEKSFSFECTIRFLFSVIVNDLYGEQVLLSPSLTHSNKGPPCLI